MGNAVLFSQKGQFLAFTLASNEHSYSWAYSSGVMDARAAAKSSAGINPVSDAL
jgi:hypothetical protein